MTYSTNNVVSKEFGTATGDSDRRTDAGPETDQVVDAPAPHRSLLRRLNDRIWGLKPAPDTKPDPPNQSVHVKIAIEADVPAQSVTIDTSPKD